MVTVLDRGDTEGAEEWSRYQTTVVRCEDTKILCSLSGKRNQIVPRSDGFSILSIDTLDGSIYYKHRGSELQMFGCNLICYMLMWPTIVTGASRSSLVMFCYP